MVAAGSNRPAAQEAGLKYFFLGALSSAIMVYGFVQGAGTTTLLGAIGGTSVAANVQAQLASSPFAWLGIVLALLGLAYKVAAVPMHFYIADVLQGVHHPHCRYALLRAEVHGLVAVMKILALVGWPLDGTLWLVWLDGGRKMTIGNALALLQDNVKRMLCAYSSVAHSGYMLIGLLVGPALVGNVGPLQDGLAAVLYYIVAYSVMNVGALHGGRVSGGQGRPGTAVAAVAVGETTSRVRGPGPGPVRLQPAGHSADGWLLR